MSGRRRMGRIRNSPARQHHRDRKRTPDQIDYGRPTPATAAVLAAVPKLPESWLLAPWSGGAPFKAMKAQHAIERAERMRAR